MYDASAICQDPNLFLPEAFSESRHLAILSNSIKPWPMTDDGVGEERREEKRRWQQQ
jgi:hypothetical protein